MRHARRREIAGQLQPEIARGRGFRQDLDHDHRLRNLEHFARQAGTAVDQSVRLERRASTRYARSRRHARRGTERRRGESRPSARRPPQVSFRYGPVARAAFRSARHRAAPNAPRAPRPSRGTRPLSSPSPQRPTLSCTIARDCAAGNSSRRHARARGPKPRAPTSMIHRAYQRVTSAGTDPPRRPRGPAGRGAEGRS